jgi:hypothetical protein
MNLNDPNIKVTGRKLTFNETSRKLNPHLFGGGQAQPQPEPEPMKPAKRIRQDQKPIMNRLEQEYFEHLREYFPSWFIAVQAMRFRLGNGIWYKPDFVMFDPNVLTAYEVKGPHAFRGGFENLKVAASLYRHIQWFLVWKDCGEWKVQEVLP